MPNTQYMPQSMMDWSSEINSIPAPGPMSPAAQAPAAPAAQVIPAVPAAPAPQAAPAAPSFAAPEGLPMRRQAAMNEFAGSTGNLDLRNHQPTEVIESPASVAEAFSGSLKSALLRNRGNFVAATLLIGSQGTTAWEGILYEVGNDYIVIYQTGRQRYILCDIYALKYIEFYDTKQREICEQLLRENGSQDFN